MNLLKETLDKMTEVEKTPEDVVEVQWSRVVRIRRGGDFVSETLGTTWDRFAAAIENVEYDNGYGTQEINDTLKIVFGDMSWLERAEYDGAEHWVYKQCPKPAKNTIVDDKNILCDVWDSPCCVCVNTKKEDVCMRCDTYSMWEVKYGTV